MGAMSMGVGATSWSPERAQPARLIVARADSSPDRPGSRPGTSSADSSGTGSRWRDGSRGREDGDGSGSRDRAGWRSDRFDPSDRYAGRGRGSGGPGSGGAPGGSGAAGWSGAQRAAWRAVTRDPYEEAIAAARFAGRGSARTRFEMAEHRIDVYL